MAHDLQDLPEDLRIITCNFLECNDLYQLRKTCRSFNITARNKNALYHLQMSGFCGPHYFEEPILLTYFYSNIRSLILDRKAINILAKNLNIKNLKKLTISNSRMNTLLWNALLRCINLRTLALNNVYSNSIEPTVIKLPNITRLCINTSFGNKQLLLGISECLLQTRKQLEYVEITVALRTDHYDEESDINTAVAMLNILGCCSSSKLIVDFCCVNEDPAHVTYWLLHILKCKNSFTNIIINYIRVNNLLLNEEIDSEFIFDDLTKHEFDQNSLNQIAIKYAQQTVNDYDLALKPLIEMQRAEIHYKHQFLWDEAVDLLVGELAASELLKDEEDFVVAALVAANSECDRAQKIWYENVRPKIDELTESINGAIYHKDEIEIDLV